MADPTPTRRLPRPVLALGALLIALAVAELAVRLAPDTFGLPADWNSVRAASPHFEPRPHLLYTHPAGAELVNDRGFIAPEWPTERREGVLRILALGASTTEAGNDGGHAASYPFFLEQGLNEFLQHAGSETRVEVINLGMAGWTTAETLVHWFLAAKDLEADLVLIHHAANDVAPRMWPEFRSDYAHYRRPWAMRGPTGLAAHSALAAAILGGGDEVTLDDAVVRSKTTDTGNLDPAGRDAFRRNVESIARDANALGAVVCLVTLPTAPREQFGAPDLEPWRTGIDEHNQLLRELAEEHGYLLSDLALQAAGTDAEHELLQDAFIDLVHVDADGNLWKALAIGAALSTDWEPFAQVASAR